MKLIRKRSNAQSEGPEAQDGHMGRREFLRRSGISVGGAAAAASLPPALMRRADAAEAPDLTRKADVEAEIRRSVCTHCS
ncbi:MAG: hypothetical protein WD138_05565, partial [Halofilum sp. (in: g-proteobacteria)]